MKVVIVGAGNVATVLGRAMKTNGHDIVQVVSRRESNAAELAGVLMCAYTHNLLKINKDADVYVIAVNDKNIEDVSNGLQGLEGIVAHTAGSMPKNVLSKHRRHGVMYPLQTLNKQLQKLPAIPVLVDGSSEAVAVELTQFAKSWAATVITAGDELRLHAHLAAIIVNNFTNHLVALTQDYCQKEGIEFSLLMPLIQQTTERLGALPAAELQTGPAVRNDIVTIEKHLQLLNKQPVLRNLYLKLSESIISYSAKHLANGVS